MFNFIKKHSLFYPGLIVGLLLSTHFLLGINTIYHEAPTFDEIFHASSGVYYWQDQNYHINPENGIFPQRLAALPILLDPAVKIPPLQKYSRGNHQIDEAWRFLFRSGNSPGRILFEGRIMILLLSLCLGIAVYKISSGIFGNKGGLISLGAYAFCPNMLANSSLITSDTAAALGFTLAVWTLWRLFHKISISNILLAALALCILVCSKFSAFIIIPVMLIIFLFTLLAKKGLPVVLPYCKREIKGQAGHLGYVLCSLMAIFILLWVMLWGAYGFRYSILNNENMGRDFLNEHWQIINPVNTFVGKVVKVACFYRLAPEAYLYGIAHVYSQSKERSSFMSGSYSKNGNPLFFPYAILIKTPIPIFALILFSILACFMRWRKAGTETIYKDLYQFSPYLTFITIYMLFAISSPINIGLRHILPVYPCVYILCGAFIFLPIKKILKNILLALIFTMLIWENFMTSPNYLAYFNQIKGGLSNAWQHLVDSSLDWGQSLLALKAKLSVYSGKKPIYISYFGSADLKYYVPDFKKLPSFIEQPPETIFDLDFDNGIFCISATMLQMTYMPPALRIWNSDMDKELENATADIRTFLKAKESPEKLAEFFAGRNRVDWLKRIKQFEVLRLAKLNCYLRQREPDDNAGYSILIYKMPDPVLKEAFKNNSLK